MNASTHVVRRAATTETVMAIRPVMVAMPQMMSGVNSVDFVVAAIHSGVPVITVVVPEMSPVTATGKGLSRPNRERTHKQDDQREQDPTHC